MARIARIPEPGCNEIADARRLAAEGFDPEASRRLLRWQTWWSAVRVKSMRGPTPDRVASLRPRRGVLKIRTIGVPPGALTRTFLEPSLSSEKVG
jgi:hypothetical protein